MFNTPILFVIFARIDTTQKVFDAIRTCKPKTLYVAADGPREGKKGEKEKCQQTRDIIEQIDWDCELKTLFRDKNLGCKMAVSSAISWFFENEESGIILEDDCLPDQSFFPYCEELLIKYKDDERIGHIGGNCFFPNLFNQNESYTFSSLSHIWGWATWRRVWKKYDLNLSYWKEGSKEKRRNLFNYKIEEIYFSSFISDAINERNGMHAWDCQHLYSLRLQNQLSIYPSINLVTNIGLYSEEATHISWKNKHNYIHSKPIKFPLNHPKEIIRNHSIDYTTFRTKYFSWIRLLRYLLNNY